jgi:PadR family transcriptional regulator, regulatory protein PadR
MTPIDMTSGTNEHALKKGTAELLVLAQLEDEARHGYDIALRIEQRSNGAVAFNVASLYPILYRLEAEGKISGRWVERRRRFYRLTPAGRQKLVQQRRAWSVFMSAVQRAAGIEYA